MPNSESQSDPRAAGSSPPGTSRVEEFDRYFDLAPAITKAQRDQVYQVRYRVYCEEFGYEPAEAFSNFKETDEFDDRSMHCLVTHRGSGAPVGCVRLVMVEGDELMPMEAHAGDSLDHDFIKNLSGGRESLCEISRLAVDGAFRRRPKEQETRFGNVDAIGTSEWERRTFPMIALSLMIGAGALAESLGKKHCFAIMEPFLPIMMRRTGIHFRRMGKDFEFRGVRAPYYTDVADFFDNLPVELRQYGRTMQARFAAALKDDRAAPVSPHAFPEAGA